jgi:leader peptidase (prepilin peptidase)/N-methyltransferase
MIQEILIFITGAMMGSAANALIDRLPKHISWAKGRSVCDTCGHVLGVTDLFPIASFLIIKGKCRYCHSPIPLRNFLVEVFMAIGFILIFNPNQILFTVILWLILWATTIIAVMDFETMLVADVMVAVWGVLVVILGILNSPFYFPSLIKEGAGGILAAVGLIGGIYLISRGKAMGDGDIGLAVVMGWWLGWPNIVSGLWLAFVTGGIAGLVSILRKKSKLKSKIAFGPFLIIGAWAGWLWGEKILSLLLPGF